MSDVQLLSAVGGTMIPYGLALPADSRRKSQQDDARRKELQVDIAQMVEIHYRYPRFLLRLLLHFFRLGSRQQLSRDREALIILKFDIFQNVSIRLSNL